MFKDLAGIVLAALIGLPSAVLAQTGPVGAVPSRPQRVDSVLGDVTSLGPASGQFTLHMDIGETIIVVTTDKTTYLRAQPGAKDLAGATTIAFSDIAVGDRVLARGALSQDRQQVATRQIIVMTKTDIAQKQERERADWRRRGIVGVITGLDATSKEITLQLRSMSGAQTVLIPTSAGKVVFRRYAPDSVKFSDAKTSSFEELRVGDQLRALGERTADGTRFTPEQVVSGAFRTASGVVTAVDADKHEILLRDAESDKALRVVVGADAMLRRIPPEFGARLLGRFAAGDGAPVGGGRPRPAGAPARPDSPGGGSSPPQAGGRGGGPNLQDLLERMPAIGLADLKPGDRILVSSTKGQDPSRLTAIALVAGLETLVPEGAPRRRGGELSTGLPAGALDIGIGLP